MDRISFSETQRPDCKLPQPRSATQSDGGAPKPSKSFDRKEYRRQYYLKNKDREASLRREWYRNNKTSVRARARKWAAENPERVSELAARWRERNPGATTDWYREKPEKGLAQSRRKKLAAYGMTQEDYDQLHAKQNGQCAICRTEKGMTGKRLLPLYVDHCHKTLKVRGLLCQKCNAGLGMFRDDPRLGLAALDYLTRSSCGVTSTTSRKLLSAASPRSASVSRRCTARSPSMIEND